MARDNGYRSVPFGINRRIVSASAAVSRGRNTIHLVAEVDITRPRRMLARHHELTGEKLSLTAYVVVCLARVCAENPRFNSFRKGRRLIVFDDVAISVLVEREFEGENVPEPVVIYSANRKTYREINDEIRAARGRPGKYLGSSSGTSWIRFIPGFLLRAFVRLASRNIGMQKRFGVVGVTAVGMFGSIPMWMLPLTSATVTAAVGSIVPRTVIIDGLAQEREHLCITLSFDHDIVDGAPAARFASRFAELMGSGDELGGVRGERASPIS